MRITSWKTRCRCFALLLAATSIGQVTQPANVQAVEIKGASVVLPWSKIASPDPVSGRAGVLSSYAYDSVNDKYYVATFGYAAGLYSVTRNTSGDPYAPDTYVETGTSTTPSTMFRFYRATDVPNGNLDVTSYGTPLMSGILLNPKAVTVTVPSADAAGVPDGGKDTFTYQPGELAFITDGGFDIRPGGSKGTPRFDLTKKMYRWDLREVGKPTTEGPDYSTGKSGAPSPNENPGGLFGRLGQADWNDVFTVAATEADMRTAYETKTGNTMAATSKDNFGRQSAWSTDGQSLYAIDTGSQGGGLYKIAAGTDSTGARKVELIYSEDDTGTGSNVIAEPAVLHTTTRDLGAGFGAGDQVLFDGTDFNGNKGGMSYVVDTGSSVSGVQTLFTGAELQQYTERIGSSSVKSIATDSAGNIYFYEGSTGSLHRLDTQGRFISVLNKAQLYEVSETNDGVRSSGGGMLRLQVREDGTETHITYRGDNSYVGAVQVFDPADVNRDGNVDQADRDFFITQMNKTYHGNVPNPQDNGDPIQDFVDYIAADLNGSGQPNSGSIRSPQAGSLKNYEDAVTHHDMNILSQFIDLELGDFNWDGVFNAKDWNIFDEHYKKNSSAFGWKKFSWFDGDVTGMAFDGMSDGRVDQYDLLYLQGLRALPPTAPEPSSIVLLAMAMVGLTATARRRPRLILNHEAVAH